MAFDLSNGLAAAGTAVAATAGQVALEAQKAELENQKVVLADQLAGKRESAGRQEQGLINATAADKAQTFQGGENEKQRASEEARSKASNQTQLSVAGMQVGAQKYATDQRTAVEREALTPAEVRTALWFSKASPSEKAAFQNQLLIKSGMPAWAAGGASDTSSPPVSTTPVRSPEGPMDDKGASAPIAGQGKKAGAGAPVGLPGPQIDEDKLNQAPAEARPTIKAMLEGRMPAPTSFAMSKPYWQTMMGLANSVDPTFDQTSWASRVATRRDFTSGKSAAAVTALNTALGHAGVVSDALEKVDNGSIPMWNAIVNKIGTETGGNKVTNATQAVDALASEARKVFAASGGGNLTELQEWQKNFPINGSKEQQQGAMKLFSNLLDSRLSALSDQYNRGMGTANEPLKLLEPHAQQVFQKISGQAPESSTGYPLGKPTATAPSRTTLAAPPPVDQRVIGRTYQSPNGPLMYMGDGQWAPVPGKK